MTTRSLAQMLIRLWALMTILNGVLSVVGVAAQVGSGGDMGLDPRAVRIGAGWNFVYIVLTIVVGVLLFRFAGRLSSWIVPEEGSVAMPATSQFEFAVFGAMGAYFVITGLQQLAMAAYELAMRGSDSEGSSLAYLWQHARLALLVGGVQVIAGGALFAGRAGVVRGWESLRAMKRDESDDEDTDA